MDTLSRLVDRAVEVSLFRPLIVGRSNVKISQLKFADDTLFFSSLEEESLSNLSTILDIFFCLISGLKVNLDKSTILGINLEVVRLSSLVRVVGCSIGSWPLKYLGLPLGGIPLQTAFWEPLLARVAKRLDWWKKAFY